MARRLYRPLPVGEAQPVSLRRALDLASNRLQQVEGLEGLDKLERLSLAHNYITSFAGLSALQVGGIRGTGECAFVDTDCVTAYR